MRASSRTIARSSSSARSARPCIRSTSACRSPRSSETAAIYEEILARVFSAAMNVIAYVRENLAGAWQVMLGRPEGLDRLDTSLEGFWRSFGVIVLVAPFAAPVVRSATRAAGGGRRPVDGARRLRCRSSQWPHRRLVRLSADLRILARAARPRLALRAVHRRAQLGVGDHRRDGRGRPRAPPARLVPSAVDAVACSSRLAVALRFSYVIARTTLAVSMAVALPIVVLDFLVSLVIWSLFGLLRSRLAKRRARIIHPHQIEPFRRARPARGGAVARLERRLEIVRAPLSFADQLQRADHRAHLVVQEGARRRLDDEFVAAR